MRTHNNEAAYLGACLIDNSAFYMAQSKLTPAMFADPRNAEVYKAICKLAAANKDFNELIVSQELKQVGRMELAGGDHYVFSLQTYCDGEDPNVLAEYIRTTYTVKQLSIKLSEAQRRLSEPMADIDVISAELINACTGVNSGSSRSYEKTLGQYATELLTDIDAVNAGNMPPSVPCNGTEFNKFLGGYKPGCLYLVAGRPGMGKTADMMATAENAAKLEIPVHIFSQEMAGKQLAARSLANESQINSAKISNYTLNDGEYDYVYKASQELHKLSIVIDETAALTIQELTYRAKRLHREKGTGLIIVDYVQLMRGTNDRDNREREISNISGGLKRLAKDLNVPVIALSQLNREVERRQDRKPNLADLRDSGSLEQDADAVIFLFRPQYYQIPSYKIGGQEIDSDGLLIKIIAKNRYGVTGEMKQRWIGSTSSITDWKPVLNII